MKGFKTRHAHFLFISILSVFLMAGCGGGGGGGGGGGEGPPSNPDIAPTVTAVVPLNNAGDVAINTQIAATFSEHMNPATITAATFTLMQSGVTPVVASGVTYVGVTAVFTPPGNLESGATYTATITTGAQDLAGHALASNFTWSFTSGTTADTTAPVVTLTVPDSGVTDVAVNRNITATFSEAMNPLTIATTSFTLTQSGVTPVPCTVTYVGAVAFLNPSGALESNTPYTATITTDVQDLAGNALAANKIWSFTTGATTDTTAPMVTLTDPASGASNVVLSKKVYATFSEAMDPFTINTPTFTLKHGGTSVLGTVTYVGLVTTFTPTSNLAANTIYTATITTGAKDLAGNALALNKTWSFTTGDLAAGPAPVDLGTAGNFAILTKAGITTTGLTHITGNIGVSPIDSTAMTGFGLIMDSTNTFSTSGLVTGNVYAANYATPTPANMTTAVSDMEIAYTDAAGRTLPDATEVGAGDISGWTLFPGLYKWSTGVLITNVGVTLSGGPNDVWIFQIAQDLTVNNDAVVTLSPGVQAKNIFWQVGGGTGVSLGTNTVFYGNILATKAIVIKNGATLLGRALAQTNVTLDANIVTAP